MSYDFRQDRQWRKVRRFVLRRDGFRCHWCGHAATQADHLVPVVQGGARYDPDNVVASCAPCNQSRGGAGGLPPRLKGQARRSVFSARGVNTPAALTKSLSSTRGPLVSGDYSRREATDGADGR